MKSEWFHLKEVQANFDPITGEKAPRILHWLAASSPVSNTSRLACFGTTDADAKNAELAALAPALLDALDALLSHGRPEHLDEALEKAQAVLAAAKACL